MSGHVPRGGNRMNTTGETNISAQDDSDEQQEVIEVQILPQVCENICHSPIMS